MYLNASGPSCTCPFNNPLCTPWTETHSKLNLILNTLRLFYQFTERKSIWVATKLGLLLVKSFLFKCRLYVCALKVVWVFKRVIGLERIWRMGCLYWMESLKVENERYIDVEAQISTRTMYEYVCCMNHVVVDEYYACIPWRSWQRRLDLLYFAGLSYYTWKKTQSYDCEYNTPAFSFL